MAVSNSTESISLLYSFSAQLLTIFRIRLKLHQQDLQFFWFPGPQILVTVFGRSGLGRETLLGYAHIHLPVFGSRRPADQTEQLQAPILMPKCPNMMADITSWLLRREPELKDPKVLLDNLKCKGLSMESYGSLQFQLSSVMRGARKLGYHWHS